MAAVYRCGKRWPIANADPAADTITFDNSLAGGTLTLAHGQLAITESMTIDGDADGSGDNVGDITIDAAGATRIFNIDVSGHSVTLDALTLKNGNIGGHQGGGAVYAGHSSAGDTGDLVIQNSSFIDNSSRNYGGAVSVLAHQADVDVTIHNNAFTVQHS